MPDDTLQWRELKKGDEKALETIFLQYHKELFQYGYKIVQTRDLVDDCIQDLFLELWQNRANLSQVVSVRAYLFTALKYKLMRVAKKEAALARLTGNSDEIVEFSYETVLIDEQDRSEKHRRLRSLISKLSPRQQEAIYLRYYCKLSYQEISTIMSISSQAVTNLVFKSVRSLREQILVPLVLLLLSSPWPIIIR